MAHRLHSYSQYFGYLSNRTIDMKRLFALMVLAVGFATSAQAAYIPASWTDNADIGGSKPIQSGKSYTYTHDLNDNGFRPLLDVITGFNLSIDLGNGGLFDTATISLPDTWWAGDVRYDFGASGGEYGGWSILGLLNLNALGTLSVTITSVWGNFTLLGSTLNASGASYTNGSPVASVPEPGALGLLGVGLLGMALSMRRRKTIG